VLGVKKQLGSGNSYTIGQCCRRLDASSSSKTETFWCENCEIWFFRQ